MAENVTVLLKGFVSHKGEIKREGEVISIPSESVERLVKLGKAEVLDVEGNEGGAELSDLTHPELDSFAENNLNEEQAADYPKSGNKDAKIDFIEAALKANSKE